MESPALDFDDPRTRFWLGMASGLLQAGGASQLPVSAGQGIGMGMQQGIAGAKAAQQEKMQEIMMKLQMNKLQKDTQTQEMFGKMFGPQATAPAPGGTQQNPSLVLTDQAKSQLPAAAPSMRGPSLDQIGMLMASDPERGKAALQLWQAMNPDLKYEGGVPLNPKTGQPLSGAPIIPQTNQQGFSTQLAYGPGGFQVGVTPGSLGAFRDQQREAARYSFEPVKLASGETVPVSRADLGDGKGPASFAPRPQPQPRPFAPPSKDPWASIPLRANPRGMGQSTYNEGTAKAQAETATKLSEKYGEMAATANQRIALNSQALELVDKSDTGTGAGQIADVKKMLVTRFGIPESSFENSPSATAALQKDLLNAATQKAKQSFGQRMTQQEVMMMLSKGAPNVDMTKEAIKYLISNDTKTQQYALQQSGDLGKYLQQGGDPYQFESWYARSFPLDKHLSKSGGGSKPPLSSFHK